MGRGPKPAKSKEAKPPATRKSLKGDGVRVRDLEKRLEEALQREAETLGKLQARDRELVEAHEQQTATSEILRVIASSPTDVRPVFEAILKRAATLCEAQLGHLWLYEGGEQFRLGAGYGSRPDHLQWLRQGLHRFGRPFFRESGPWRVGQVLDVRDTEPYRRREPVWIRTADHEGMRTLLAVPLVKDGRLVGSIAVYRREVQPFTDQQTALVQTFADQAVIAIENVRLFKEVQTSNSELTEALDQQTATSEILRVISSSPTDIQPVFDAVAESAARLCEAYDAGVWLRDGEILVIRAHDGPIPMHLQRVPISRDWVTGRAVVDAGPIHVDNLATAGDEFPEGQAMALRDGHRTTLATPLLREGKAIGAILIRRTEVRPFSDKHIALLKTFADQAVIAIENVRLFTELQEKNRALTQAHAQISESLEQQTATSEILRVISSSPTDVQPVFDTIARNAVRLCAATHGSVNLLEGEWIRHVGRFPREGPTETHVSDAPNGARVIREGAIFHVPDTESDSRVTPEALRRLRSLGARAFVSVPMKQDIPIGSITVYRSTPGGFPHSHVALLQTFADQAVIAIENVRLFKELEARTSALARSVDQLTALGEVGRAVSSTLDLDTVLTTIVSRAVQLTGLDGGVVFEYDQVAEEFIQRAAAETGGILAQARRGVRYKKGDGALGRTAITLEPVQVSDITVPGAYASRVRENLIESGVRAILAVPMIHQGRLTGCLGVTRNSAGDFSSETVELLRTFATQSALAIQNARLFREIEEKSRQVEAASQHKSEFLANMSHELRTPLNAIIGFSEVLTDRMFGELNEKQEEYLKDIYASGTHLLSLINDILDLSKIEAGRMELELSDFDLPTALDNALTLVRERAQRRSLTLHKDVDGGVGQIQGDERKIRQVVLNLLSNAIKFTPEGGRIELAAVPKDGCVEVSVSDTGLGIAPEDQDAIFEEFRQVGTAEKKAEGTGLGLTLCRKFIELHGGKIWVKSQPGVGSTFTFTIPVRSGQ